VTSAYPERRDPAPKLLDCLGTQALCLGRQAVLGRRRRWARMVRAVALQGRALAGVSAEGLLAAAREVGQRLRSDGLQEEHVARAFALTREAAAGAIGERHYDVQLVGGWMLLHGLVAEMETGEGKTLTATLPAVTAALAGIPVHIITVNDYLAARDAEWMAPIYRALGLRVGVVVHGLDPAARQTAYASDVTYCTNKEIVFDYLRDRLVLGRRAGRIQLQVARLADGGQQAERLVLRGLHYAIVDEADSVLVDEARTPLIISGAGEGEVTTARKLYQTALALAERLAAGRDYLLETRERRVELTAAGEARLRELTQSMRGAWKGTLRRHELVRQALTARHLFHRDTHYLVRDGKVQIIDEYTGRLMGDRSWEHGLHQLIEAKEGVAVTRQTAPLARISYQRFFRRYLRLAGMTGTAREVAGELRAVYGLPVVRVPTNRRLVRQRLASRTFATAKAKWEAVVARIRELHDQGRPVLVGTRSVGASEHLAALLDAAGLAHVVLNARQDREEAQIIARAGEPGRITVATNMAGRGTDIRLARGVVERGGLHVLATERHEAGRIDRQLFGRCGRQGDPGSYETFVSLQDELVAVHARRVWVRLAARAAPCGRLGRLVAHWVVLRAQARAERLHSRARRDMLRLDEHLETALAFSGRGE
jgi:preprotein translocase subunit SecA